MIAALMRFVQHDSQDKFQILEDVTPPCSEPSSPVLSASPGLFFSRLRRKLEIDDEVDDEISFSPCSSSTPQKSSPLATRPIASPRRGLRLFNQNSKPNAQPATTSTLPSKRPLKRKGLSVVEDNVSPTENKRFRFEEHCFDYEKIEKKQEKRVRKDNKLETRLDQISEELEEARCKLIALESVDSRRVKPHIDEVLMRRRALHTCNRVLHKKLVESKAKTVPDRKLATQLP